MSICDDNFIPNSNTSSYEPYRKYVDNNINIGTITIILEQSDNSYNIYNNNKKISKQEMAWMQKKEGWSF